MIQEDLQSGLLRWLMEIIKIQNQARPKIDHELHHTDSSVDALKLKIHEITPVKIDKIGKDQR